MGENTEIIEKGLVAVWIDRLLGKNWQNKIVGHVVVGVGALTVMQASGYVFPPHVDHILKSVTAFATAYACYRHRGPPPAASQSSSSNQSPLSKAP